MNTSENEVIARLRSARSSKSDRNRLPLGLLDDAALLAARPGYELILTCDWFLEGTHFWRDKHPADAIGWKSLARALSDIAAMGGAPVCCLLSLAVPKALTGAWLTEFVAGFRRASRKFRCPLAGGDTTQRREILISVTVIGEIRADSAVLRSGARPGDSIFVSGRLGEADLGLELLRRFKQRPRSLNAALRKHLYPEPRLALGQWLSRNKLASAMMDLSDGLSSDLPRLCAASQVGARIDADTIPAVRLPKDVSAGMANKQLDLALNGGDDYELLFAVRPNRVRRIPGSFRGIDLTRIGEITAGRSVKIVRPDGREEPLLPRGWDPFRQ